MKRNSWNKVMTVVALMGVLIIGSAWGYGDGQGRRANAGNGEFRAMRGLDLTDSQQEQIKTMRVGFMKEMTPMRNSMNIKRAELKAASTGDNVDAKAVNNMIEELGKLKTDMAKKRFANHQKVRTVLSDEQKVIYDARCNQGMRSGRQGQGFGQGRRGNQGNFNKGFRGQGRPGQGQGRPGRGFGNQGI